MPVATPTGLMVHRTTSTKSSHGMPFGKFDKDQKVSQGEVVDNKDLGAAVAFAQRLQKERD